MGKDGTEGEGVHVGYRGAGKNLILARPKIVN